MHRKINQQRIKKYKSLAMAKLKQLLPSSIYDVIERAGVCTTKQILTSSTWDLKKVTNLNLDDSQLLQNVVADYCCPVVETVDTLMRSQISRSVATGVSSLDNILHGGLRRGTLTELYGEGGSGKTQLAIQAAAHNWASGTVYICTEDLFPVKRFNQITTALPGYSSENDYGKSIFVEHMTESDELLSCVRVRLPKLLAESYNIVSLVVLDSVAAPFRTDTSNYVQRAEDLRELAVSLVTLAQKHNLAVLCINQVTASFDEGLENNVIPSLGLAWSNMIPTRLWIKKVNRVVRASSYEKNMESNLSTLPVREVCVVFAPDVPYASSNIIVTSEGIHCIVEDDERG